MVHVRGNDLDLGFSSDGDRPLKFPHDQRNSHLYVCGGTNVGKSKFLESLIRQDILNWPDSKCGLLLLDPHGSLFDSIVEWMAWNEFERPVIPIDLRCDDWIVSYNLLRQRPADPAVIVDNVVDSISHVWGAHDLNETPLLARWAANVLRALYENELPLVAAENLLDFRAKQFRNAITSSLKDPSSRRDWAFADTLAPRDFEAQIGSTTNRLQRFIRNRTMRAIFGQPISLDFDKVIEDGSIVLVSLATEHTKISKENAQLFAVLLLTDLWTAMQNRGKRDSVRPFYAYLDEFQRFITPTMAENLDEARGFGLHLTMAHQFPCQLLDRGDNGRRVFNSVMENASSKVVFRLSYEENLRVMAQWLALGIIDLDEVKYEQMATRVLDYREEVKTVIGESRSTGEGYGVQHGHAEGGGEGGTENFTGIGTDPEPESTSVSQSGFASDSESESRSWSKSATNSKSLVPTPVPILGKEASNRQFRTVEEQIFRMKAAIFRQKQRQAIVRLVSMEAPASILAPFVDQVPSSKARVKRYLDRCYSKLPFAMPRSTAEKQVEERERTMREKILGRNREPKEIKQQLDTTAEPATTKQSLD